MSKVYPLPELIIPVESVVSVAPLSPRREGKILFRRADTGIIERAKRFKDIDIDVIKHDKWYYINIILTILSLIIAIFIAEYYPPCENNKIPNWIHLVKYTIYGITAFVWVKIQIGIYRYHHPKQPKFMVVNP